MLNFHQKLKLRLLRHIFIARITCIIKYDIEHLIENNQLLKFSSLSFSLLLLERLSKTPEARNYILHSMESIYDDIDFDLLQEVDLHELAFELPELVPNQEEAKIDKIDSNDLDDEFLSKN